MHFVQGCAARGEEIAALQPARARRISQAKFFFTLWAASCISAGEVNIQERRLTAVWYVIQVQTGREEQIMEEAKCYQVQEYFDEIFAPHSERKKKYLGKWHLETELLFPGYLFVITSRPEELYQALKRIPKLTKLLGTGEKWTPMTKEDIEIVELLSGRERLVKFSEGYIQGDRVTVTSGPLKGLEGKISRIDRHKRLAWLKVELFGRTVELQAGLEVIRKE